MGKEAIAVKAFDEIVTIADHSERNEEIRKLAESEVNAVPDKKKITDGITGNEKPEDLIIDEKDSDTETPDDKEVEEEEEEESESDLDPDKDTQEEEDEEQSEDGEKDSDEDTPEKPTEEELAKQKDERINAYMQKHQISRDSAEKLDESVEKHVEKYGGDIREAVKASIFAQRMYSKLQHEIKEAQRLHMNPFEWKGDTCLVRKSDGKVAEISADDLINDYRSKNEDQTAELDDKAVLVLIKQDQKNWFDNESKQQMAEVEQKANHVRSEFVKSLPDDKFKDQIAQALGGVDSVDIIKGFDLGNVTALIKGKHYDQDKAEWEAETKKREKAAYEKGRKNSKIVGKESKNADTKGSSKAKGKSTSLTDAQKMEAHKMFNARGVMDDSETYKLYEEYLNETDTK